MHYDKSLNKRRWLAYFDLLGIRALLAASEELQVFIVYNQVSDELRKELQTMAPTISYCWFSDTFLMIASDDSPGSFEFLNRMARYFTYFLIQYKIPFRGAISCGQFYSDVDHNIFFGKALVEAYEYGEGQDWIGLLLSPSAEEHLKSFESDSLSGYTLYEIPWKRRPDKAPNKLPAHRLGCDVGNSDSCITILREMMSTVSENVKMKYSRTVQFLEESKRVDG